MEEFSFKRSKDFEGIAFKKAVIISEQILLYFIDFIRATNPQVVKTWKYDIPIREYDRFREKNKTKFSREMYRLKQAGIIKEYLKGKEHFIKLTKKGKKRLKHYSISALEIERPKKWDGKWRLVIFDIPDDKRVVRDLLRRKLENLGFFKLQESVYVFPFECAAPISYLKRAYFISPYVQYILADRIETEVDLVKKFYDLGLIRDDNI